MVSKEDMLRFGLFGNVDPRKELWAGISFYMGEKARWIPPYEEVCKWLSDNQGRGLISVGSCGLGKSLISMQVLPVLFKKHFGFDVMSMPATEMNTRIDEVLAYCEPKHIIIIDDLGAEPPETVTFGNRRHPFCELVDKAERTGALLIITTNLRTTKDDSIRHPSIEERYGIPTLDRLKAITKVVLFTGQSLRG